MLVHITVNLNEAEDKAAGEAVLELLHRAGVRDIDSKFLHRYGLVSGDVDPDQIEAIEALAVVQAVEPDGSVSALSHRRSRP
ncbi:hypothetical protein [Deinococcus sedimenti]|uniref:Uncharacterized protein n=1 Tax=Deinococcus sedimenti TaxID=1867090 RepID=A0ABQ2S7L6_9DEIO|nr:hypothetical protein [Deinococcus sedimenti]GGS05524.1 hypothetical protein GCM10008960_35020 [Deinococcus sedimenti]